MSYHTPTDARHRLYLTEVRCPPSSLSLVNISIVPPLGKSPRYSSYSDMSLCLCESLPSPTEVGGSLLWVAVFFFDHKTSAEVWHIASWWHDQKPSLYSLRTANPPPVSRFHLALVFVSGFWVAVLSRCFTLPHIGSSMTHRCTHRPRTRRQPTRPSLLAVLCLRLTELPVHYPTLQQYTHLHKLAIS